MKSATHAPPYDDASSSLERDKLALLTSIARDRKAALELESSIAAVQSEILTRKAALGKANALFMTLPDAAAKAPRQRLGANNAVIETVRIIARETDRVRKEGDAVEAKLNKAREKNSNVRASINTARKDAVTFRKLFIAMTDELKGVQFEAARFRAMILSLGHDAVVVTNLLACNSPQCSSRGSSVAKLQLQRDMRVAIVLNTTCVN